MENRTLIVLRRGFTESHEIEYGRGKIVYVNPSDYSLLNGSSFTKRLHEILDIAYIRENIKFVPEKLRYYENYNSNLAANTIVFDDLIVAASKLLVLPSGFLQVYASATLLNASDALTW